MGAQSKEIGSSAFFWNLIPPKGRKALVAIGLLLIGSWIWRRITARNDIRNGKAPERGKGHIDAIFVERLLALLKIVVPHWKTKEVFDIISLNIFLVIRTMLSIYIAGVNGKIVNAIIKLNFTLFLRRILALAICAIPASFVNSYLDFLIKRIAIHFRKRMTHYYHERYIKDMIFYQISNLDVRIANPDQRLTVDIEKWAMSLSSLYSNFSKPLLDIVLFSRRLADLVGWEGPILVFALYIFNLVILRTISPAFGKLTAQEQRLEGDYRGCHNDLIHHAEEIAFCRGDEWEKTRINESFQKLINHSTMVTNRKLLMGCFDALLTKYGAVLNGFWIVGLPVFGPKKETYLKKIGNDKTKITRDIVQNSSLLINLSKAIGRLVVSYKELQYIAGYTTVVAELKDVISDLEKGKYQKDVAAGNKANMLAQGSLSRGEVLVSDYIKFDDVPLVTPNGDILSQNLSFEIKPGMDCFVTGPNGCGKSSMFRILGSLWPALGGSIYRPSIDKIFYIPQRPYLPHGTLRDQIIYPQSKSQFVKKYTDNDLFKILEKVHLAYLVQREGGFDAINDWYDVLSGGEKQRIAMARLFYHKPQFAILDECTSAVSMDVEHVLYSHCKELGITLFTVSHRTALMRFHDYLLKFNGEGDWKFEKIIREPESR